MADERKVLEHTAQQIDEGISRSLPGGSIDLAIDALHDGVVSDVNQLKADLGNLDSLVYTGESTITPEMKPYRYIDKNGQEVSVSGNDALQVSDYIKLSKGISKIKIHLGAFSLANFISFYSDSKEFISGYNRSINSMEEATINVPQESFYFRLSNYTYVESYDACYAVQYSDINISKVHEIESLNRKFGFYPIVVENTYYNVTDGKIGEAAEFKCTKIKTSELENIGFDYHSIVLFKGGVFVKGYLKDSIPTEIPYDFDELVFNFNKSTVETGDIVCIDDSVLYDKLRKLESAWKGKKINFIGDSITYGAYTPIGGSTPNQRAAKRYCEVACEMLGATCVNYGVSGTSVSGTTKTSPSQAFVNRYQNMADADAVFILGGTNDYGTNVVLGTESDTTDVSFYGALDVLCRGLIEKYLGKTIVWISPIPRYVDGVNSAGHTFYEYKDAIEKVVHMRYGIRVIDGFDLGVHIKNETFRNQYMPDGLHPTEELHAVMGEHLANIMRSI